MAHEQLVHGRLELIDSWGGVSGYGELRPHDENGRKHLFSFVLFSFLSFFPFVLFGFCLDVGKLRSPEEV